MREQLSALTCAAGPTHCQLSLHLEGETLIHVVQGLDLPSHLCQLEPDELVTAKKSNSG